MFSLRALPLLLIGVGAFGNDLTGLTEAAVIQRLGAPSGKASLGSKTIYQWSEREVVVIDGIVASVRIKPTVTEQEREREVQASLRQKEQTISSLKNRLAKQEAEAQLATQAAAQAAARRSAMEAASKERQQNYARRASLRSQRAAVQAEIEDLKGQQQAITKAFGYSANANRRRNQIGQVIIAKQALLRDLDRELASLK